MHLQRRTCRILLSVSLLVRAHGPGEAAKAAAEKTPLTILVVNRDDKSIRVYPPEGLDSFLADPHSRESAQAFAHVGALQPLGPLPKTLAEPAVINSLASPLDERASVYAQTVLRQLEPLRPVLSPKWTAATLRVVSRARGFEPLRPKGVSGWPSQIPLLLTELAQPGVVLGEEKGQEKGSSPFRAMLVLVEVRADSAAGAVEQVDFFSFGGEGYVRTYWSRDLLDPTYFKPLDQIFLEVSQKFIQRVDQAGSLAQSAGTKTSDLRLLVHRTVGVRVVEQVQDALSRQSPGVILEATGFDPDLVQYKVALSPEASQALLQSLRDLASGPAALDLKESRDEAGQLLELQLTPWQEKSEAPFQAPTEGESAVPSRGSPERRKATQPEKP